MIFASSWSGYSAIGATKASSSPGFGAGLGAVLVCCGTAWPIAGRELKPSRAPASVENSAMRRMYFYAHDGTLADAQRNTRPACETSPLDLGQRRVAFSCRQQTARRDAHAGVREAIDIAVHQVVYKAAGKTQASSAGTKDEVRKPAAKAPKMRSP